ncbi:hypothetical protein ACOSQ2_014548 [Xanthoceras sorbifolium]
MANPIGQQEHKFGARLQATSPGKPLYSRNMKDNTKQSGADFSEEVVPSVSQWASMDLSWGLMDEEKRLGMDKLSRPAKWKKLAWYSMRVERAGGRHEHSIRAARFHFEESWALEHGCKEIVMNCWDDVGPNPSRHEVLSSIAKMASPNLSSLTFIKLRRLLVQFLSRLLFAGLRPDLGAKRSVLEVEALAVLRGVEMALESGITSFMVESDSATTVNLVRSRSVILSEVEGAHFRL